LSALKLFCEIVYVLTNPQNQGEEEYPTHTITRGKAIFNGHILRRNCLLKHIIDGKIEEK
jgi:hypothetical protein